MSTSLCSAFAFDFLPVLRFVSRLEEGEKIRGLMKCRWAITEQSNQCKELLCLRR